MSRRNKMRKFDSGAHGLALRGPRWPCVTFFKLYTWCQRRVCRRTFIGESARCIQRNKRYREMIFNTIVEDAKYTPINHVRADIINYLAPYNISSASSNLTLIEAGHFLFISRFTL